MCPKKKKEICSTQEGGARIRTGVSYLSSEHDRQCIGYIMRSVSCCSNHVTMLVPLYKYPFVSTNRTHVPASARTFTLLAGAEVRTNSGLMFPYRPTALIRKLSVIPRRILTHVPAKAPSILITPWAHNSWKLVDFSTKLLIADASAFFFPRCTDYYHTSNSARTRRKQGSSHSGTFALPPSATGAQGALLVCISYPAWETWEDTPL